ncbi:divalent-cation tolerance protein CutA [Alteromonas sp. ASW11-130]|uniref:divalent-cation tolerance protein CutA n=1 Tax=Alteromonas sp. ASW11-130 TaxID=3015775 RepID=UPI002242A930|nr:divalent-cation tolerance protein CutA [Alteromonas sp. ASW11-130]MCW8093237.1 divalent-cation tolerance protein CutA [Alteromonas sp. ASW11-130]
MSVCVVFCTVPEENLAKKLATSLVEKKLAACVKVIPKVTTVYRWEEKVVTDSECQLIIKTVTDNVENAFVVVSEQHPYDVPEWLVIPDAQGSDAYISWIREQTNS